MAQALSQSLVHSVAILANVVGAGRDGMGVRYCQPRAILSLPSRTRTRMPNRMQADERLNPEAASAERTGRSASRTCGLPHPLARSASRTNPSGWSGPTGKRPTKSFTGRIEIAKPCVWHHRYKA